MNPFKCLMDMIYPLRCHVCGDFLSEEHSARDKGFFCERCVDGFIPLISPVCTICSIPFAPTVDKDHVCEDCLRKRPVYESIFSAYLYEGTILEAIHRFKYDGKRFLYKSLGPLFAAFFENRVQKTEHLLTIPVPLHPKRIRQRGFNQSLLLARHLAGCFETGLDFLSLRRSRYTLPQIGLGRGDRRKNVRGAFRVVHPERVEGKSILLVDDVATTGNTLNECARVLMKSGAEKVICLVLARAGQGSQHGNIPKENKKSERGNVSLR